MVLARPRCHNLLPCVLLAIVGCSDRDTQPPGDDDPSAGTSPSGGNTPGDDAATTTPSGDGDSTVTAGPGDDATTAADDTADTGSSGTTDGPPVGAPDSAIHFFGLPWSGDAIGELRIQGTDFFWVSMVMPHDGEIEEIRQYLIGVGDCSYGCGDGGVITFAIHRDDAGTPGPEVAAKTLSAAEVSAIRANAPGSSFTPVDFDPVAVAEGERIWIRASNEHPEPSQNYISLDPLNMHARWAEPDHPEPVSSVDPMDRQLTIYDQDLSLLRHKHHIIAAYYTDGRVFGNGYVISAPNVTHNGTGDKWATVRGEQRVRQRFTPDEPLTFDAAHVRIYLASGRGPLTVTVRQGGRVVTEGSAASWVEDGWGYDTDGEYGFTEPWRALVNAQWGAIPLPRATLQPGLEATIELSTDEATEYRAVGLEYGSNHVPGAYHTWPEAEHFSGGAWQGWDPREEIDTGHLSFFFPLAG